MKSAYAWSLSPASLPLAADDITELHAARILLLLEHCGNNGRIHGLTKLAKLDFFVRYPDFFERVAKYLKRHVLAAEGYVESAMVRHHYGPWDKRYYQVIAFLEARGLLKVEKNDNAYDFVLTPIGEGLAKSLSNAGPNSLLVQQMRAVKSVLGRKGGTQLKNLVYELFGQEVKERKLGEIIQ